MKYFKIREICFETAPSIMKAVKKVKGSCPSLIWETVKARLRPHPESIPLGTRGRKEGNDRECGASPYPAPPPLRSPSAETVAKRGWLFYSFCLWALISVHLLEGVNHQASVHDFSTPEPRLRARVHRLVMQHTNGAPSLAAGMKSLPNGPSSLTDTRVLWRFPHNP